MSLPIKRSASDDDPNRAPPQRSRGQPVLSAAMPPQLVNEDAPEDLIAVGRLTASPEGHRGEVSHALRLKVNVATYLTDLIRIPRWFIALNGVEDTEAPIRRPVMLKLTPISFKDKLSTLTHMIMSEEGRVQMKDVICCPSFSATTGLPRWFRIRLNREGDNTEYLPARFRDRKGNVDFTRVGLDYWDNEWVRGTFDYIENNATVYVRRADFEKQRAWIGHL